MSCEQETLRVILQNKFDRIENLVQMNHATTLAIPSVLATIWGIEGGFDNFQNAWILSVISIGLVLIWRFFAHYLDNDITKNYSQIIDLEQKLKVPTELSLFQNLFLDIKAKPDSIILDDFRKRNLIKILIKRRKIGTRGHEVWDSLAFCIITICLITMFFGIQFLREWAIRFCIFFIIVFLLSILGNMGFILGLSLLFSLFLLPLIIPVSLAIGIGILSLSIFDNIIQKNPTQQDFENALNEAAQKSVSPFNQSQ